MRLCNKEPENYHTKNEQKNISTMLHTSFSFKSSTYKSKKKILYGFRSECNIVFLQFQHKTRLQFFHGAWTCTDGLWSKKIYMVTDSSIRKKIHMILFYGGEHSGATREKINVEICKKSKEVICRYKWTSRCLLFFPMAMCPSTSLISFGNDHEKNTAPFLNKKELLPKKMRFAKKELKLRNRLTFVSSIWTALLLLLLRTYFCLLNDTVKFINSDKSAHNYATLRIYGALNNLNTEKYKIKWSSSKIAKLHNLLSEK